METGGVPVKSKDGLQIMQAIISGFMLFVIIWSSLFDPTSGDPYTDVMAKMFGQGSATFAGLGLLVMVLVRGGVNFRGAGIAFVLAATFTSFMWFSS